MRSSLAEHLDACKVNEGQDASFATGIFSCGPINAEIRLGVLKLRFSTPSRLLSTSHSYLIDCQLPVHYPNRIF